MDLFRITKEKYIRDISGEGARRFGGRWNHKGTAVLYTAQSEALAALEILVHVPISAIPGDLKLAVLSVPDNLTMQKIKEKELPKKWRSYPAPHALADLGTQWINSNTSLMLKVPSVLVHTEMNVLINPAHPDAKEIGIKEVREFSFDPRLHK